MEFDLWTIVSAVLGLVAVVAGGFFLKAKGKIAAVGNLIKQAYEVVAKLSAVLEDNKVTSEEVAEMKKELQDVKDAFKALVSKSK
jgi:divalent metal cation (Fe/Co/Zn/Cd) transporter